MSNIMEMYSTLSNQHRGCEDGLVNAAVRQGIVPDRTRYELQNTDLTGIMKATSGDVYFFNYNSDSSSLNLILADNFTVHRAEYIFTKSTNGFDLIKADEEEEEKAMGAAGGQQSAGGAEPVPMSEEQQMHAQNRLMTEQHPGAAIGITPDLPNRGRVWHQDTLKSLEFVGELINKSVEQYCPTVSPTEKQFMVEVLGKVPHDVDNGDTHMTPLQKVTYQKWLTTSVQNSSKSLNNWLSKAL